MMKKVIDNSTFLILLFSVFFSSMLGAQILGISLNKIALIPLIIYLIFSKNQKFKLKKNIIFLLLFLFISLFSSLYSLTNTNLSNYDNYIQNSLLNAIQIFCFYIPIVILIAGYNNKITFRYNYIKALVITCRIHVVWSLLQFIIYSFFKYSINDLFSFLYTNNYNTAFTNLGTLGVFIRPTGLTSDPAFFGVTLVFGFILDKNKIYKFLYFCMAILSLSRVSIVVIVIIYIFKILLANKIYVNIKRILVFSLILMVLLIIVFTNEMILNQVTAIIYRFNIIGDLESSKIDGTSRHLLYIPMSFKAYILESDIINLLIGFGPRQSGAILAHSEVMNNYLAPSMINSSWSIECDIAELILGYGLIGFIFYYGLLIKMILQEKKTISLLVLSILIFGIMYNISSATLVLLTIITFYCTSEGAAKKEI